MRLAILVPGGVDRSGESRVIPAILSLLRRLARRHDVQVFVPAQEPRPGTWRLLGSTVHNMGRSLGTVAGRVRLLQVLLRIHRRCPFDLFHAFWARGPGEVALAAARICRRPVLVHVAGGELVWLSAVSFGARRRAIRSLARFVVRHADCVTAASGAMLEAIARVGGRPVRLPLGVDTTVWIPEPPRPRPADRPARLVSVGSLTPVKGHATLLEAIARLTAAGWLVIADLVGEDTSNGAIPRLARTLGIADRVICHGFLPQREVVRVVRAADVMVVASHHEAGPVAMLEAAAVGVPTVGTAVGHVRDWAPDAAIAVPAGDPAALAGAIADLLRDDARRLAVARCAQELALREDAEWTAARIEELYSTLVGRADGRRVGRAAVVPKP
ncbi:MAG TPA: glycosyltransferase [Candidatus Tectomicrobia bacterium]|nr:glycosyltransferase [Candidatus Tectomicrobia bacterium]